jgi:thioredoxin 1
MATVAELNDVNFSEGIKGCVALVDFWAPWCAPCLMQGPIVEQVAARVGDKAKVVKVNVDESLGVAMQLGIQNIPTLIVFKDGTPVQQFLGVTREDALVSAIEEAQ